MPGFNVSPASPGGIATMINVTEPTVIKASQGILYQISVVNPGSGGTLAVSDCTTLEDADADNTWYTAASGSLTAGQLLPMVWPCLYGICISAVPTGGSISVAFT